MTPSSVPATLGRMGVVALVAPSVPGILHDRLGIAPQLLGAHVMLGDDLAIDSLDLLEVVIDLESAFGIVVPEQAIDRVRTVADLIHVVAKYLWERDHAEPFDRFRDAA